MTSGATSTPLHVPVLRDEVLAALDPHDGDIFVDGTFGAGGYSRALLEAAECRVFAFDRDPVAIELGKELEVGFEGRFSINHASFSKMDTVLRGQGIEEADGVALDIGLSSMQLADWGRGFSFDADGPLDMRMSREGRTAAEFLRDADQNELEDVFRRYGEEPAARRIAKAIVNHRTRAEIRRTKQLADIVTSATGGKRKAGKRHPATRIFLALRILINDELGELRRGLGAAERILAAGGRLCVVSFHSLEDRIVKRFFLERSGSMPRGSRHRPEPADAEADRPATFRLKTRGVVKPREKEIHTNPRARSAHLRIGFRTTAPPWSDISPGNLGGEAT